MVITKFLESLSRRRALKSFTRNGAPLDITPILEAARLAPSSFGVQPYFIHVVTSPELKQAIYPIAYSQDQIIESSHLLIFSARSDSNEAVERYLKDSATEGGRMTPMNIPFPCCAKYFPFIPVLTCTSSSVFGIIHFLAYRLCKYDTPIIFKYG